jgi:hypothetical protein
MLLHGDSFTLYDVSHVTFSPSVFLRTHRSRDLNWQRNGMFVGFEVLTAIYVDVAIFRDILSCCVRM